MPDNSLNPDLQTWAIVWLVAATITLLRRVRGGMSAGLVVTYVLSFGMLYWVAPVLYLLPWFDRPERDLTAIGLKESAIAMVAFAVGAEIVGIWMRHHARVSGAATEAPKPVSDGTTNRYLAAGLVLYVGVTPLAGSIPSLSALASAGSMLAVIALSLRCWNAWVVGAKRRVWSWLAVTCTLPLVTVVTQGFLGYGFAAMLTIFAFVASFYRPRWFGVMAGLLLAYVGLSVYVTYMRDRSEIRALVWGGAKLTDRFDRLTDTVVNAEWFDYHNEEHLSRIDLRLNQAYYVGAAIVHLDLGKVNYANGATLMEAVFAVVPRALWPNKPSVGGSGDLVSIYTGIRFAEGTSVGIGQVMECYINFGTTGVVMGFILLGGLLVLLDQNAARVIARGNVRTFIFWFLPGLGLLQVGGSFVEMTSTAGAGLVIAWLINRIGRHHDARAPRLADRSSIAEPNVD